VESAASETKGTVEARTVGMTTSGADRVVAYEAKTHCPRLEGLVPWFLAIEAV